MHSPDGMLVTAAIRDVSERRKAEEQIKGLNAELEEALRRSDRLANTGRSIASLAHEINNPIDALSNILFMLRSEKDLSKNQQDLVSVAAHELDRLITITRQTLAPHRQTLQPVVVTVNELLDSVCESFGRRLQQAGITVSRNYADDGQVKLQAGELRQVLTNLISNAIDAMPNGGTLRLETRVHSPSVEIRVGDTGHGIRSENLEAIFKPFFTTKGERGLGVGLWVSRRIIEKLGGTIAVDSSTGPENHGTWFSITLPWPIPKPTRSKNAWPARHFRLSISDFRLMPGSFRATSFTGAHRETACERWGEELPQVSPSHPSEPSLAGDPDRGGTWGTRLISD